MIFYTKQHKYYYEVDLHANKMYILYASGKILLHRNFKPLVDGSMAFRLYTLSARRSLLPLILHYDRSYSNFNSPILCTAFLCFIGSDRIILAG